MGRKEKKENILVTGGGGFVGMALCLRLVNEGHNVASFSRKQYAQHQHNGVYSIVGDIRDKEAVFKACKGIDTVFHVASKVGVWGRYRDFDSINVTGTSILLEACLRNGVKRFIYTSSASVVFAGSSLRNVDESIPYSTKRLSPYTHTKAQAEALILATNTNGFRTISLRPHLIWGPNDSQLTSKIIARAKSGRMRQIGSGKHLIDTTYIDNLIDAQILAYDGLKGNSKISGKAYFITNNEPIEVWNFINSLLKAYELPAITKKFPKELALVFASIMEFYHRIFQLKSTPFLTRFLVKELCTSHWFNIQRAQNELGYHPRISLKEGFKRIGLK